MLSHTCLVSLAGTAGLPVAARLSKTNASVLLIEAGGPPEDSGLPYRIPGLTGKLVGAWWQNRQCALWVTDNEGLALAGSPLDWNFTSFEPYLNNRTIVQNRGKALGGCSAINGMTMVISSASVWNHTAALGNLGWGWEDNQQAFRKVRPGLGGTGERQAVWPGGLTAAPHSLCRRSILPHRQTMTRIGFTMTLSTLPLADQASSHGNDEAIPGRSPKLTPSLLYAQASLGSTTTTFPSRLTSSSTMRLSARGKHAPCPQNAGPSIRNLIVTAACSQSAGPASDKCSGQDKPICIDYEAVQAGSVP